MKGFSSNTLGPSSRQEWKYFAVPEFGCIDGIPTIRGKLIAQRGVVGLLVMDDGREVVVHVEHFNRGCK